MKRRDRPRFLAEEPLQQSFQGLAAAGLAVPLCPLHDRVVRLAGAAHDDAFYVDAGHLGNVQILQRQFRRDTALNPIVALQRLVQEGDNGAGRMKF